MFGYIDTAKDIEKGAKGLNQTFMCGLCISTKKLFGNLPRMAVNNDINFFNVLFHSYMGVDVDIEHHRCVASVIKKRTIIATDDITHKLSIANVILMYLNMYDDIVDGSASVKKKVAISSYKGTYNRAVQQWPELDEMMRGYYEQLRTLEQGGVAVIDRVCHPFAQLSREMARMVINNPHERLLDLCYNIGKWIYLIDALDDMDKDSKKGNYNVLLSAYGASSSSEALAHIDEIQFVLYSALNSIAIAYNDLALGQYKCILDSTIYGYIRTRTSELLDRYSKEES